MALRISREVTNAVIVTIVCDRGDRYLSTGVFPGLRRDSPSSMTPVLAFDIETVPDVAGIRRLHDLPADLPDREVAEIAFQRRRTQTGSDFLPPHLQRVVAISCALREGDGIRVLSLDGPEAGD